MLVSKERNSAKYVFCSGFSESLTDVRITSPRSSDGDINNRKRANLYKVFKLIDVTSNCCVGGY